MASKHPRITCVYSTTKAGHNVKLDLQLPSKEHLVHGCSTPLMISFHGGGLFMGSRRDPDFTPAPTVGPLLERGCIIVYPDYRLLEPSTCWDELEDIVNLRLFLEEKGGLDQYLPEGVSFTPGKVAFSGYSAGSYMARMATANFLKARADGKTQFTVCANMLWVGMGGDLLLDYWLQPHTVVTPKPAQWVNAKSLPEISSAPYTEGLRGHELAAARDPLVDHWWQSGNSLDLYVDREGLSSQLRNLPYSDRLASLPTDLQDIIPQVFLARSPLAKLWPDTLLIHGTLDEAVPYDESVNALQQMKEIGIQARLVTVVGGNHNLEDPETKVNLPEKAPVELEASRFLLQQLYA